MTDTLWSDISEWQVQVNDRYPYGFICIRSNDGSYLDLDFPANYSWCKSKRASGKLWGFMVYYFYRPGVNGAHILMSRCGKPDPRMVVMIDCESASGQVAGNQSGALNAQHDDLAKWLGDPRRVVGYGNVSDLNALWPAKPKGMRIVVAAYGSNPGYPNKFAHQFADNANIAPFGPSDLNSADGMSINDLLAMYGFSATHPATPPVQSPGTKAGPTAKGEDFYWKSDGTLSLDSVMSRRNSTALTSIVATKRSGSANDIAGMVKYVSGGTSHPMPDNLIFFTTNA